MPLSFHKIEKILTSEDLGVSSVAKSVPFTFTYTGKQPAQLLNLYWTYFAAAGGGTRTPSVDVIEASGSSRFVRIWGRQFLAAGQVERNMSPIGATQAVFFGVTPYMQCIPDDLYLYNTDQLVFTSIFASGVGDLQVISFQLGIMQ